MPGFYWAGLNAYLSARNGGVVGDEFHSVPFGISKKEGAPMESGKLADCNVDSSIFEAPKLFVVVLNVDEKREVIERRGRGIDLDAPIEQGQKLRMTLNSLGHFEEYEICFLAEHLEPNHIPIEGDHLLQVVGLQPQLREVTDGASTSFRLGHFETGISAFSASA
jgi:hypothetical protein